jgi:hypothetical protein
MGWAAALITIKVEDTERVSGSEQAGIIAKRLEG